MSEGTIYLETSMPSPGLEARPYGTPVSVTNHYTEWAASKSRIYRRYYISYFSYHKLLVTVINNDESINVINTQSDINGKVKLPSVLMYYE
ncbi:hypothetical protein TNCV_3869861 [Trichonephila clavipes]|nr:hypothetical protein TNCV_3869861 [Trichonephila clavipes]